ncbi:predicted protein [Histoplasma mississippiense (nom. inval.)]|uniref:predicted protein n=1 Tax=Ajellomyces capsulatus (strain NAm1 / WU24) TaxID=2059318 RepID=UPI000157CD0F|nr:predicted protein [Histoplasma mississippiense (nom. inval.)]EDN10123.1 predicted protein [Histoplasma mississippiense (nom. inval.)]
MSEIEYESRVSIPELQSAHPMLFPAVRHHDISSVTPPAPPPWCKALSAIIKARVSMKNGGSSWATASSQRTASCGQDRAT